MKIIIPDYYKDFKCIGGECIDTCCAGWEVDVDKESSAFYKGIKGPFGDRLRSELRDFPVEDRFQLKSDGRCPFLNEANLCDIYTELGEKALCQTCTNFPRHITEFGSTREIGISLSCPVAVSLIMNREKPILFETSANDEVITSYNDIDADLYFALMNSRKIAFGICQDREISINSRAALLLCFSGDLQKNIKNINKIRKLNLNYSDNKFLSAKLDKLKKKYNKASKKKSVVSAIQGILDIYDNIEHIKPEWPGILEHTKDYVKNNMEKYSDFDIIMRNRLHEYEHLLVYYVFRYFLRAVFDYDVYSKSLLGVLALIIQKCAGAAMYYEKKEFSFNDQITVMRIYSKETEHSEENLEYLYNSMKKNKYLKFGTVVSILFTI